MTTPTSTPLDRLSRTPWRARIDWAITAVSLIAFLTSLLFMLSYGLFIGAGAIPLFLLGAWLSPSPGRRTLAVGEVCWGVFCVIVLTVAWLS